MPLVLVAFFVLFAAAAGQWAKNAKLAQMLAAPPPPAAPALPDFALNEPTGETTAPAVAAATAPGNSTLRSTTPAAAQTNSSASAPTGASSQTATTPSAGAQTAATQITAPSGAAALPQAAKRPGAMGAGTANAEGGASGVAPDVQRRADAAFGENALGNSNQAAGAAANTQQPLGSVLPGKGPSYIFVGHYEREDRAQDASRKIEGLGLTSIVIPRRGENGQKGFAVVTGPFPPERIPSVIDWLRTQGFNEVREVKGFGGGFRGRAAAGSNVQANPDGNSE